MYERLRTFRDSATHAAPETRALIQTIFECHYAGRVTLDVVTDQAVYRVSCAKDNILNFEQHSSNFQFFSACRTLEAARKLLERPPNPLQDRIVEVIISGPILIMPYDDGVRGIRKSHEQEIIVPYSSVTTVRLL